MPAADAWLDGYLKAMHTVASSMPRAPVYPCYESVVLDLGIPRHAPPSARPRGVPKMTSNACFDNALSLAQKRRWTYGEGYVAHGGMAFHHAYCVRPGGRVVDPTWETPGSAYRGLELPPDIVEELLPKATFGVLSVAMRLGRRRFRARIGQADAPGAAPARAQAAKGRQR